MSVQFSKYTNYQVGGLSIQGNVTRENSGGLPPQSVTMPAGKAGTLTTRSDDNTGVATLSTGHGIASLDVCDVYWTGGVRYGMTATVSTNAVTLDGGAGTVLPAQDTAVVVCKQVTIDIDFVGDNVTAIVAAMAVRGHLHFVAGDDSSIFAVELLAGEAWDWTTDNGVDNPFASATVASLVASNGSETASTLYLGGVYTSSS